MKQILLFLLLNLAFNPQDYIKQDNTYSKQVVSLATETKFTFKDKSGNIYPIYISKNGRCYIIKTSKEGKEYKYYLGEAISKDICKELGIEYVETNKK